MRILSYKLKEQLAKGKLQKIYLVTGNEHFLMQETTDTLKKATSDAGFLERLTIPIDSSNWIDSVYTAIHSLSLLSPKRLIELNLTTVKLTQKYTKKLTEIINNLPNDIIFIIQAKLPDFNKIPAWQKSCEEIGAVITVLTVKADQLPQWIYERAKLMNLPLSLNSSRLLAHYTEGNLLAAAQELEKLTFWQSNDPLTKNNIDNALQEMINDNARFDIFQLANAIKIKNPIQTVRVLSRLLLAGTEPALILWVITRELRQLEGRLKSQPQLLHLAAHIDLVIKGIEKGSIKNEMEFLVLAMTNSPLRNYNYHVV